MPSIIYHGPLKTISNFALVTNAADPKSAIPIAKAFFFKSKI